VDLPLGQLSRPEKLLQHGGIAGMLELSIQVVADEVKKGLEMGVAGMLGELLLSRLVKKESTSSEDMESGSLSRKWSRNLLKTDP